MAENLLLKIKESYPELKKKDILKVLDFLGYKKNEAVCCNDIPIYLMFFYLPERVKKHFEEREKELKSRVYECSRYV
jgi:hypothetical protein